MRLIKDKHDFGGTTINHKISVVIPVKNTTNKDITIKGSRESCTCTETEITKGVLKPNETRDFKISITPGSTGSFLRSAYLDYYVAGVGDKTDTIQLVAYV